MEILNILLLGDGFFARGFLHHIDYNKFNNNEDNLVSLCDICHGKTNYNREKWIKIFKNIMKK